LKSCKENFELKQKVNDNYKNALIPNFSKNNVSEKRIVANETRIQEKEKYFTCLQCDFQGTKQFELNKHMNLKHSINNELETIKCYHCDSQYSSKWNLMNHRKSVHPNIIAHC